VEQHSGERDFRAVTNPVSAAQLLAWIAQQEYPHGHLSLTGGEPLLHLNFLQEFLPQCPIPVYLETGGHRPRELAQVLPHVVWVSLDLKLPSSCGERPLWEEHRQCLVLCQEQGVNFYTKWVVTENTTRADLLTARDLVAAVDPNLLVVLQPVTPLGTAKAPTPQQVLQWQALLRESLTQVRVIPQTHKFLNQL
jgi:organic radical activating enzyme